MMNKIKIAFLIQEIMQVIIIASEESHFIDFLFLCIFPLIIFGILTLIIKLVRIWLDMEYSTELSIKIFFYYSARLFFMAFLAALYLV